MKICFKCRELLDLQMFYPHPSMADGHLNKCIQCTKQDSRSHREIKLKDPIWVEQEMKRCRDKQRRRRELGLERKMSRDEKREIHDRHKKKYPERNLARQLLARAVKSKTVKKKPCAVCCNPDSEGHHDDYSKPLDVIWLCAAHHAERHVHLRMKQRLAKHGIALSLATLTA